MCGIAGFYNAQVNQTQIQLLMQRLHRRGPDGQQFYLRTDVGLIHTRLSIIELSDLGSQPYRYESLVLVYNGELYNYKEIREELEKFGYSFQSNSDTEVLIKAFHCWKEQCVSRFIGMFSFCIYDEEADEIFLFRDRLGVKPLYFSYDNGILFFASELQALSVFDLSREINTDAVSLYFRFGFVPRHFSIYKSLSKLEAGHYLKISRQGISKTKYWNPGLETFEGRSEDNLLDELEELLISSFRYRMVSDVPVGVFLSGGIDSSLLTAILQKHHGGIHSFTIGFDESGYDESAYASRVANHLKTRHTQRILKREDARDLLTRFYSIYDEPFADTSGIPTSCVALLAKEHGIKVVLSADGGDELFGGYPHYPRAQGLFKKFSHLPDPVRRAISKSTRRLFPPAVRHNIFQFNFEHKLYAFEEAMEAIYPAQFFEALIANQASDEIANMLKSGGPTTMGFAGDQANPLKSMMTWDLNYSLPDDLLMKVDRATMFHSMECREPFLDHRLVEFALRIPTSMKIHGSEGKYLLRKLVARYMPMEYHDRKKQGFSIPIFAWFSKELDNMFVQYLSPERLSQVPFFDAAEIHNEHKKYLFFKERGMQYNIEKMWRILSFMLWWEKYIES